MCTWVFAMLSIIKIKLMLILMPIYVDPLTGEPLICDSGLQHIYYYQIALLIK